MTHASKERTRSFKNEERAIRALVEKRHPMPGSPDDELDCLVHNILGALHRGESQQAIEALITREMTGHFGLTISQSWVRELAQEAARWWNDGRISKSKA